jgi:magnesium-transporting ATPase (P-type)
MTDFIAAYFMLCLAVVLFVVALIFKQFWIHMISGGFWAISGLYFIINSGGTNFIFYLGLFCVIISLPLFLAILWAREKKDIADAFVEESYEDKLDKKTRALIEKRSRYRAK